MKWEEHEERGRLWRPSQQRCKKSGPQLETDPENTFLGYFNIEVSCTDFEIIVIDMLNKINDTMENFLGEWDLD